jgi:hypothetical protein
MEQRNERELVERNFYYLFEQYGFTIVDFRFFDSFSNWMALLISAKCRLKIYEDRGSVMIAGSPLWDPPDWEAGPWYDLSFVVEYLTHGEFTWDYDKMGSAEPQLKWLAEILHPYTDQICALFQSDSFPDHEENLHRLWVRYVDSLTPGKHS